MSCSSRIVVLALALSLVACAAEAPVAAQKQDRRAVTRTPLAKLDLPLTVPGGASLVGAWEIRSTLPISGLSAMALDGERLLLATDNGDLFQTSCPAARPLDACSTTWEYDGRLIARGAPRADLEALAIRPDRSVVLGLENRPRLASRQGDAGSGYRIGKLPDAPDLGFLPNNEGPEAMTALPDGRLIVIPEGGVDGEGRATVLLQNGAGLWQRRSLDLPQTGLRPTEAAVAGDYLFMLLRGVGILSGWQGMVLVLPLTALNDPADALPQPVPIADLHDAAFTDNFEAMAVRRLQDGSYSLLIGSDDNGFILQRPLLLALRWTAATVQP